MKKTGENSSKTGALAFFFSKNEISLLRPAINEWRPKNSQFRIDLEFFPFFFRDAESLVYTYKKEMRDMETQLKQQQNLYSAVRNDRTGLAKSLTEAQDEISDLKVV